MNRFALIVLVALACTHAGAAHGQSTVSGYAGGSFEAFLTSDRPGHGALLAGVEVSDDEHGWRFGAHLNTETIWLEGERQLSERWSLGAFIKGEALAANVLPDRYVEGGLEPALSLRASYLQLGVRPAARVGRRSTLRLDLAATRWWFDKLGAREPSLVLPETEWIGGASLVWTWWRLRPDAAFDSEVRRRERLNGLAFGASAGVEVRDRAARWGTMGTASLGAAPDDTGGQGVDAVPRVAQRPEQVVPVLDAWLRAGVSVSNRVRLQLHDRASWRLAADDIVRARIGGQADPYVLPISGQPWAVLRSGRHNHAMASAHVRVGSRSHELGLQVDGVVSFDDDRLDVRGLFGASAFADLRWEHWQVDVQAGASPGFGAVSFATLAGFGWQG